MSGQGLFVAGEWIELDEDGHLIRPEQWRPEVGQALARRDGIELTPEHWWLIEFVRAHQCSYGTAPLMRVVVAALRQHRDDPDLNSRQVYRLFSDNPVRRACKYGGLDKPDWCI